MGKKHEGYVIIKNTMQAKNNVGGEQGSAFVALLVWQAEGGAGQLGIPGPFGYGTLQQLLLHKPTRRGKE